MRLTLALIVLITMVIGTPASAHARLRDDTAATASLDEVTGPPCIEVPRVEIAEPVRQASIVALPTGPAPSSPTRAAILTAAPKTSPPASRS